MRGSVTVKASISSPEVQQSNQDFETEFRSNKNATSTQEIQNTLILRIIWREASDVSAVNGNKYKTW